MSKPLRPHIWEPPVLVWTVGKVASSSVYATLKHHGFDTIHIHYLSDWYLTNQINKMYAGRDLATNIATSVRFRHGFDRNFYKTPFRVVTLVRDPLARNISAYFENLEHFSKSAKTVADSAWHIQNFLDRYPHSIVLDWFDAELRDVGGVDFRQINFDPDRQWCVRRDDKFHVLIIRAEAPDQVKLDAMSEFFGMPMTSLIRQNEAADKHYNELYQAFRDTISFPKEHIDYMYDNDLCETFWTPTEVRRMRNAWNVSELRRAPGLEFPDKNDTLRYSGPVAPEPSADEPDPVAVLENAHRRPEDLPLALRKALGSFHNDGKNLTALDTRWDVDFEGLERRATLRISFDLKQAVEAPSFSAQLYSSEGILVSVFEASKQAAPNVLAPGPHVFKLSIDELPLMAGLYLPVFSLTEGKQGTIVHRMPVRPLLIEDEPGGSGLGLVRTSFHWIDADEAPRKRS